MASTSDMSPELRYFLCCVNAIALLPGLFYKAPEMAQFIFTGSTEAISLIVLALEILGFTINFLYHYTYNYDVVSYVESPIILVQLFILALFTLKNRDMFGKLYITNSFTSFIVVFVAFTTETFDKSYLKTLIPLIAPLTGIAKLIVMIDIVDNENADQVSLTYWCINLGASSARVITAFAALEDGYLVMSYGLIMILNLCVIFVALFFQTRPALDLRPFRI